MSSEPPSEVKLEIGHILFIDIVGYSKLLTNEQRERLQELNRIVRETGQFREAEAASKLIRIPTGDGMVLAFFTSPDAPVRCAVAISRGLSAATHLPLRMGIHSGPVELVEDVSDKPNLAGAGVNIAQRVMSCGDAGHILLSARAADDLTQYAEWKTQLHEVGEAKVKHGVRLRVVSLYGDGVGNAALPQILQRQRLIRRRRIAVASAMLAILVIGAALGIWDWQRQAKMRRQAAAQAAALIEKSIAVLPFENLSEEKANAFFADGVQDEILTDLARVADLKVISRTSTMFYKAGKPWNLRQIAQQLGVANVVEGSVQRAGKRVRVNAQLIDARTDKHLWGQTYDRDLADVFAIQSEIARTIADQLQAKLSPTEKNAIERSPTNDIAAFDLYTRAKTKNISPRTGGLSKTESLQAVDLLNQALAHDPSFFDAYCQLAFTHDALYFLSEDHTPARLALAEAAIDAAARLRPAAGETHLARAQNLYWGYRDYDNALAELEIARQTLPNDSRIPWLTGLIQRRKLHWEESTQNLKRAAELNPRDIETLGSIAANYWMLRRYADQKSALARTLAVFPDDAGTKVALAGVEFDSKADTKPLHQTIDSIRATNPARTRDIADWWLACALAERDATAAKKALDAYGEDSSALWGGVSLSRSFVEGIIARMTGDDVKAGSAFTVARTKQAEIVRAQPNYGSALCALALIDAGLGHKEDALREGKRAVELLPVEKDPLVGVFLIEHLAMIAAWVGDKDLAIEQLDRSIRLPTSSSYGELKLFLWWDPLRGDPRFEKIVEEAKKPVALK